MTSRVLIIPIVRRMAVAGYCLAALCLSGLVAAQEPEVLVELGHPKIYEGESVRYSVLLNHCESSAQPTMPVITGVTIRHVGVTVVHQSTFDGFKRVSFVGPRHEYILTPEQTGEVTIPGPTVVVDRKTYRGDSLTLQVLPPSQQDLALVEASTSRKTVYPLQPFQVRLTVAVKGIPDPHTDKDPLRGCGGFPLLTIPWANDDTLPEGIEPDSPAQRWRRTMLSESPRPIGFVVNDARARGTPFGFGGAMGGMAGGMSGMGGMAGGMSGMGGVGMGDPFSFLTDPQRVVFHPKPRRVPRKDADGRTVDYWEYTFERTMTATKLGTLSFGPVKLKGSFAAQVNSAGEVMLEEVYAIAKPITVEVRGAPLEGRPTSYIGAVGRFDVQAEITPTSVKVGDPMTFSLRLFGEGALSDATAPKLDETPAVADAFKVYEATEDSGAGERRFKFSLRPKKAGLREFPSIELAYFDYEKEKYVTLRTDPLKIEVAESDRLANQDIAVAPTHALGNSAAVETNTEGIFGNITDPESVYDERVRPDAWFLSLGSMACIFIVCSLVTRQLERRRNDPSHQRRRLAAKKAMAALEESRRLAASGERRQTVETLSTGIIRFVADAVGSNESGLTSRDVARELASVGVPQKLVDRCQQLLDEFDAARYGGGTEQLERQIHSADQLLSDLIREFRQRKLAV